MNNILNESMSKEFMDSLISSQKYGKLNNIAEQDVRRLMENTRNDVEKILTEGTLTADIAQFTPILLPIVRRVYPNLIAHSILGVQPMSMPTGYIYAWVNKYTGDGTNKVSPAGKCVIVELEDDQTTANVGETVNTDGKLLHKEGKLALISVGATEVEVNTTQIGGKAVKKVYTNEAAFGNILSQYTGPYTTAAGEVLGDDSIKVTATTVRVPVLNSHSESINVEFDKPCTLEGIYEAFRGQKGLVVMDDVAHNVYPMPILSTGHDEVYVGRIRLDDTVESGCNIWCVADNIRKGAASNAVQIAEYMINNAPELIHGAK